MLTKNRFLIELDCLLDTRMGCVAGISDELAMQLITSPGYHKRYDDNFTHILPSFPQEEFERRYANRNADNCLRGARVTRRAYTVRDMMIASTVSSAYIPIPVTVSLDVNVYPFTLEEARAADLVNVLGSFLETNAVTLICKPPEEVTPKYIRSNYNSVVMYDFDKWINLHVDDLHIYPMPNVSFHVPAIMKERDVASIKMYDGGFSQDAVREGFATKLRLVFGTMEEYSVINFMA